MCHHRPRTISKNFNQMKKILLGMCSLLMMHTCSAQQKNIIKLSTGDCVNCVSSLSHILEKDPAVTFLVRRDAVRDSSEIWEKFELSAYRRQFIWSNKLYDSLSREPESELIQFCDKTEVSRCSLRRLKFMTITNCKGNQGAPSAK